MPDKMPNMLDITAPDSVEVLIRDDKKVVWVNVDGICRFRACRIKKLDFQSPEKDFADLLTMALTINDKLNIDTDHATFEGSMNEVEDFRELVNKLHWKYKNLERGLAEL